MLLKARGFSAACVLTLALGIGCATTMFSLFEGPILNRPPVRDLDRIANVWAVNDQTGTDRGLFSVPNFLDLRSRNTAFEEVAALARSDKVLRVTRGAAPSRGVNGLRQLLSHAGRKPKTWTRV